MAFKPRLLPIPSYPPARGPNSKRWHCPLAREFKGSFTRQSEASQRWYTWFKSSSRTGPTIITSDLVSIGWTKRKNRRPLDRNFVILRFFSRIAGLLEYRRLLQPRVAHMSRVAFPPRVAGNPRAMSFSSPLADNSHRSTLGREGLPRRLHADDNGERRRWQNTRVYWDVYRTLRRSVSNWLRKLSASSKQQSSGQLTPTLDETRDAGDEEMRAAAGESASPSRGSRKHQRARQQHQRVGQIIPTYLLPCA